jgi:hypothetical protein
MSSLSTSKTSLQRKIHRALHEIEERVDVDIDKVANIIELWEEWREKNLVKTRSD